MGEKQLIIAVEGTAALGPFWKSIATDYLEKVVRSFVGNEVPGQKASSPNVELALVMFNTHGCYSGCLIQRTGWTKVVDTFLQWLYAIPFGGGGFNNVAVTEGLSEALMMFAPLSPSAGQTQQNVDGNKHCILVAASDPYPLPTPVFRPQLQSAEKIESLEGQAESRLSDAEAVAKTYALCSISLSVICPKQLPKLRAIYNAGRRNPHAADTPVDAVKSAHHLVLVSENFKEARAALSRSGTNNLLASQTPVKVDAAEIPPVTGLSTTSVPPVNGTNGPILSRQQIAVPNVPATVKVEPNTGHMAPASFPTMSNVLRPTVSQPVSSLQNPSTPVSQEMSGSGDGVQEAKPVVSSISLPTRPTGLANVKILNEISQARQVMNSASLTGASSIGLPSMGQTPVAMHMSNMISSGMASSVPTGPNVFSAGQPGIASMEGLGSMAGSAPITQNITSGSINSVASNAPANANPVLSQPLGSNLQGGVNQLVSGISQGNGSISQMGQNGMSLNQMSGIGSSTVAPGSSQMMPNPNMPQLAQSSMQPTVANNNLAAGMPLTQQTSNGLATTQSKYVKVWEGNLSGQRQGQPVFITRLEGYRSASASEKLAENWPATMQIVRLISQDHMNNKQYVGKADFLVFRAMNSHGFLGQLQEKKLCAVIQLVSQTLLLSVSDKACRLIGMLFPGDMVVFKPPQMPTTQQQQQLQQHQMQQNPQLQQLQQNPQLQQLQQNPQLQQLQQNPQLQQLQQNPQLQQLQQQQQQQQQQQNNQHQQQQQQQNMVGTAMSQGFGQGPTRSQLVPPQGQQQQVTSQAAPTMQGPGAGFMS